MPAPSDQQVETALAEPAAKLPRSPRPADGSAPAGPIGAKPAGPHREPFLIALLRALAVWPA